MNATHGTSVSRRGFVTGASAAVITTAALGLAGIMPRAQAAEARAMPQSWDLECDVIVIGFGVAGTGAATAAADAGAEVILLEKAPEEEAGGSARVNGGYMTINQEEFDNVEYCYRHLKGEYGRELIQARLDAWPLMDEWIEQNPVDGLVVVEGDEYQGYFEPSGSHNAYPSYVDAVKRREGITVMYQAPAIDFVQSIETGEVLGVWADQQGQPIAIKARRGVVLATGSYTSNSGLVQQFHYSGIFISSLDSPYNTGDGLYMAARAGAKLGGFFPESLEYEQFAFKVPSEEIGTGVMYTKPTESKAHHIFVNRAGKRFMNEMFDITHTRDRIPVFEWDGTANDYVNSPFWMVFDDTFMSEVRLGVYGQNPADDEWIMTWNGVFQKYLWSEDNSAELERGWIVRADTIEELAAGMQATTPLGDTVTVDAEGLARTVEEYNAGCAAGEDAFGRPADFPNKLEGGPYYAIEMCMAPMYAYGGPQVDVENRVVDTAGQPIGRLYAAGQVTLTFSPTSCVPTSLTAGIQAGRSAAGLEPWE